MEPRSPDLITLTAPAGLRLWDTARAAPAGEGLRVAAFPLGRPALRRDGAMSSSGAFVLRGLPGLARAERGAGDELYWATVGTRPFTLLVDDPLGRFLPCVVAVELPARGPLDLPGAADAPPGYLPLYSAPTRAAPAAAAALRAELERVEGGPAAWAMLELLHEGVPIGRGFTDAGGRAALFFAYPEPAGFDFGLAGSPASPLSAGALAGQRWGLELRVRTAGLSGERLELPAALGQPPGALLGAGSPYEPPGELSLEYGRELFVAGLVAS